MDRSWGMGKYEIRKGLLQCKGGWTLDEVCRAPTESAFLEMFRTKWMRPRETSFNWTWFEQGAGLDN